MNDFVLCGELPVKYGFHFKAMCFYLYLKLFFFPCLWNWVVWELFSDSEGRCCCCVLFILALPACVSVWMLLSLCMPRGCSMDLSLIVQTDLIRDWRKDWGELDTGDMSAAMSASLLSSYQTIVNSWTQGLIIGNLLLLISLTWVYRTWLPLMGTQEAVGIRLYSTPFLRT